MNPANTFFTSDEHFGGYNHAVKHRHGFTGPNHMDATLIEAWNNKVPKNGHTFVIGDFSVSKGARTNEILEALNGTKYLLLGNHDHNLNRSNKDMFKWVKHYHEQRIEWCDDGRQNLVLCHYPFRSWNKQHYSSWNLHGHTHGNMRKHPGQLDIGVDSAMRWLGTWAPFSYKDVREILKDDLPLTEDHHQPPKG